MKAEKGAAPPLFDEWRRERRRGEEENLIEVRLPKDLFSTTIGDREDDDEGGPTLSNTTYYYVVLSCWRERERERDPNEWDSLGEPLIGMGGGGVGRGERRRRVRHALSVLGEARTFLEENPGASDVAVKCQDGIFRCDLAAGNVAVSDARVKSDNF